MVKQLKSMNPGMRLIVSSLWRKHLIWERKGTNYLCCPGPQKLKEKLNTEVVPGGDSVLQQATSEFPSWHPFLFKKIQGFNALWPAIFAAGTLGHVRNQGTYPKYILGVTMKKNPAFNQEWK